MAEYLRARVSTALPLITFGVIAGVSFLAQPAKFLITDVQPSPSGLHPMYAGFELVKLTCLLAVVRLCPAPSEACTSNSGATR